MFCYCLWQLLMAVGLLANRGLALTQSVTYYTNLCGNQVAQPIEPLNISFKIRGLLHVPVQRLERKDGEGRGEREREREREERGSEEEREGGRINKHHLHTYGTH